MNLGELLILSGRMDCSSSESEVRPTLFGTGSGDHWCAGVLHEMRTPAHRFLGRHENRLASLAHSIFAPKPPPTRPRHPLDIGCQAHLGGHPDRFSRICLWLLIALLALAAVACGFGAQEIRHQRDKHQAAARIRTAEQARQRADLACRQMHTSLAVHLARAKEQTEFHLASYHPPAKAKPTATKS